MSEQLELASNLVELALKNGAEAADAMVSEGVSLSASARLGKIEDVERAETKETGLRVIIGQNKPLFQGQALSQNDLDTIAKRAVDMARLAPDDPYCGLAPKDRLAKDFEDLDILGFPPSQILSSCKIWRKKTEATARGCGDYQF